MILAVKRKGFKSKKAFIITFIILVGIFSWYYNHMQDVYANLDKNNKEDIIEVDPSEKSKKLERIIFSEAETIVDLIGQSNVREIEMVKDRLVLVVEPESNIDPLMIRYGVLALVKRTPNDIKIAIKLDKIVESNYEED